MVSVDVTLSTTFAELYETTMSLAKLSPLYSAARFENVQFTMVYFTESGEERHGAGNEQVLSAMDADFTITGPLLRVIKFEKKSSRCHSF